MKLASKKDIFVLVTALSMATSASADGLACTDLTPTVTAGHPAITTSGSYYNSYPGWLSFDADRYTAWVSELYEAPAWLAYRFDEPTRVDRYSIDFTNGSLTTRAPKVFELQGYSDGAWQTLDRRTNETSWQGSEKRSYSVAQPGLYTQYRLLVEQDNDSRSDIVVVSIGDFSLESCGCAISTELTPVASGPSPAIVASGSYNSSYEPWRAFDSSLSSMWISRLGQTPAWISHEWASNQFVEQYTLTYTNGRITTRAPLAWTLEGWDGSSWITVDTRSNQTSWSGFEQRTFNVQSPGGYKKYRLHVEDDNDDRLGIVVVSLGDISFSGCTVSDSRDTVSEELLYGQWQQDHAQSVTGIEHYVPTDHPVEPARFRNMISLNADGTAKVYRLAPNDAHYYVDAVWELSGTSLTLILTDDSQWSGMAGTHRHVYEVLQADDSNLRLRVVTKEKI